MTQPQQEQQLRRQALHYLPCFIDSCPQHETYLHWLTGQYASAKTISIKYTRKSFYEYRNGTRLITPDVQKQIADLCRTYGWTGALNYDAWEKDFLW